MKIEIEDLDHIFSQVYRIAPPTQKDDYKFLNALRSLVEKNVSIVTSLELEKLSAATEDRDEVMLQLAYIRREKPIELAKSYLEHSEAVKECLRKNESAVAERRSLIEVEPLLQNEEDVIEWKNIESSITPILEKIDRAYTAVEEYKSNLSYKNAKSTDWLLSHFKRTS